MQNSFMLIINANV